ncbi:signal peptidase II [Patescibacteria group bacterium]|nr:signal peptidase II [Patescibacteria group bacterium]MBU1967473.1 signal peptidase II [Patescibacteria group bacterium]MBU2542984.1 signal peptidase II [Patescibacteria group bacterium]
MFWLVFLLTFLVDQFTKLIAPLYFKITLNYGVSLGWFSQIPTGVITLALLGLAVGLAYMFRREWHRYPVISGLFWAGLISNLLDRILFGGVTDWLQLPMTQVSNNLADMAMSLALLLLLVNEIQRHYGHSNYS